MVFFQLNAQSWEIMSGSEFSRIFHLAQKQDTAEAAKSLHFSCTIKYKLASYLWAGQFLLLHLKHYRAINLVYDSSLFWHSSS